MLTIRSTAFTLLLIVAVSSATAQIQLNTRAVGEQVPSFEYKEDANAQDSKTFSVVDDMPGRVVVFFFWRSKDARSLDWMKKIQAMSERYRQRGVSFVSMTTDKNEQIDKAFEDEDTDVFRGDRFVWGPGARPVDELLGAMSQPSVMLVDPWGYISWRGTRFDTFEQRLEALVQKTKPHAGDNAWLQRKLSEAERLKGKGEYARAFTIAKRVLKIAGESSTVGGAATTHMDEYVAATSAWIKKAVKLAEDKKYDEAARIMADISVRMEDTDVIEEAELELGRMRGDRRMKDPIRKALEDARGQVRNEIADELRDDDRYVAATKIYREVVKDREDTPAAEYAQKQIDTFKKNAAVRKQVQENRAWAQATRWLDMGDHYAELEMNEQARDSYQRIIDEHPGSDAAGMARERLKALRN